MVVGIRAETADRVQEGIKPSYLPQVSGPRGTARLMDRDLV